jgi:hypothetical protein
MKIFKIFFYLHRYFAAHQKFIEKGDVLDDIFLTGILKSYSNCLEMLEEGRGHNDIENNVRFIFYVMSFYI